mgnify:FL=1
MSIFERVSFKEQVWRLICGATISIFIIAIGIRLYAQYVGSTYYNHYPQMQYVKRLANWISGSDKWGGKTPEETVRLFTEAVKKGDFELAAKYGNHEQIASGLGEIKAAGRIDDLVRWLENGKMEFSNRENNADLITYEDGKRYRPLSLRKIEGGTWKIDEF